MEAQCGNLSTKQSTFSTSFSYVREENSTVARTATMSVNLDINYLIIEGKGSGN